MALAVPQTTSEQIRPDYDGHHNDSDCAPRVYINGASVDV
jgi:hypothetical protein